MYKLFLELQQCSCSGEIRNGKLKIEECLFLPANAVSFTAVEPAFSDFIEIPDPL